MDRACPNCGQMLGTKKDIIAGVVGWKFKCKKLKNSKNVADGGCGRAFYATTNTLLFNARLHQLGADTLIKLVLLWVLQIPQQQVRLYTDVGADTLVTWYGRYRYVAYHDYKQIGGVGDVVEIDQTHVFENKDNRGRVTRCWIFGGISRQSEKIFCVFVRNRSLESLLPIMQHYIDDQSYICSASWGNYNADIGAVFAGHSRVNREIKYLFPPREDEPLWIPNNLLDYENRDKEFVGPWWENRRPFRYHTQLKQNIWLQLKRFISKRSQVDHAEKYAGEWMYRKNILRDIPSVRGKLERFLQDCARVHPGVGRGPSMSVDIEVCQCRECHPLT